MLRRNFFLSAALAVGSMSLGVSHASAQPAAPRTPAAPPSTAPPSADSAEQVIIQREALKLIEPDAYRVPLYLVPNRSLDLTPLMDGVVSAVLVKPGQRVSVQAEALRLDPAELQLIVDRAKANHRAAQIEAKIASGKNDPDLKELADARLQAAKADLDLATLRRERATIRAPFAGDTLRVHVVEGQLVRAGQPVLTIGDTSAMKVEVPVDRTQTQPGQTIDLRIEDRTVQGKVEAILPLAEKFEPLRDLVNSVASAVVVLDNARGEFKPGQTVYAPLIPRYPVAEVPNSAVQNGTDGTRNVQVVRENVIRDVPVEIFGSVGADRVHVSGPFAAGDEAVVSSSQPLADGSQIRAIAGLGSSTSEPGRTPQQPSGRQRSGF